MSIRLTRSVAIAAVACAGLCAGVLPAVAQNYPTKPVRMIIPFAPGGNTDIIGRVFAPKFGENLGQQVIVDNRGGAGGTIGTEIAARTPPDGYTLLMFRPATPSTRR